MSAPRYSIDSALEHASPDAGVVNGPGERQKAPAWDLVYRDHLDFDAEDDAEAVDRAEDIQRRHDGAYLVLCGGRRPSNWSGRPRYVDRLFRIRPDCGLEHIIA